VFLAKPAKEDAKLARRNNQSFCSSLAPLAFLARESKFPRINPPSHELESSQLKSVVSRSSLAKYAKPAKEESNPAERFILGFLGELGVLGERK
jgi:hypothetical protein